jgi:hypothetical protein
MAWLTAGDLPTVREYWPTVDEVDPAELVHLLASAQVQCEDFAPTLTTTTTALDGTVTTTTAEPPVNYLKAQAFQARALYRSSIAGSGDQIGGDGFTVTVFPMDWTVKALLRPRRPGSPAIA